jgi:ribosomal protein S18 acetylase RimI-like enzyme
MNDHILARAATDSDWAGIWAVLKPIIRDGGWCPIQRDFTEAQARAFWFSEKHHVFVGASDGEILWTYWTCPIHMDGGSHVANAAYAVSPSRFGQGLGHAMVGHSLESARTEGYRAMLYTTVLSTNERAVRIYEKNGFETLARVPEGFLHPLLGYVDTLVMHRTL